MRRKILWSLFLLLSGLLASVPLCIEAFSGLAFFAFIPYLLFLFWALRYGARRSLFYYYRQGFLFFFGFLLGVFHFFIALYPMEFAGEFTPAMLLTTALEIRDVAFS